MAPKTSASQKLRQSHSDEFNHFWAWEIRTLLAVLWRSEIYCQADVKPPAHYVTLLRNISRAISQYNKIAHARQQADYVLPLVTLLQKIYRKRVKGLISASEYSEMVTFLERYSPRAIDMKTRNRALKRLMLSAEEISDLGGPSEAAKKIVAAVYGDMSPRKIHDMKKAEDLFSGQLPWRTHKKTANESLVELLLVRTFKFHPMFASQVVELLKNNRASLNKISPLLHKRILARQDKEWPILKKILA